MVPSIPKKLSRTPKRTPKPVHSKFSTMKRRLQLKPKDNIPEQPVDPVLEDDLDVEPLGTEVPQPRQNGESLASGVPPRQQDDRATYEDELGQGVCKRENKNKSNLFNRSSPMKIVRVCKGMTKDQRQVIANADFGDVLNMKCSKLNPELCRFLMGCFNPHTCELDFGGRGRIPVNLQSVVRVMGVPMGSIPVSYKLDVEATRVMLEMFGIQDGKQPTLASLEKDLGPSHPADQIFLRKFMIYLVCSMFAPTTAIGVSPRCYPSLIHTEAIRNLNWPKFIIDIIIQTAKAKDRKNWFKACMPYLMVLYVDSLETDAVVVPEDGTRVCMWTNKMVNLVVDLDTQGDGSFGKLPLKQCFRKKLSLFSAEPSVLDLFINTYAPGYHTADELAKYRVAITDMCNVFEDGLAKFLENLSRNDSKGLEHGSKALEHDEDQHVVQQVSNRPGRTTKTKRSRPTIMQHVNEEEEVHGDMHMKTTSAEVLGPASKQTPTIKRKLNDEGTGSNCRSPKMLKPDTACPTETVETAQTEVQIGKEPMSNANEETVHADATRRQPANVMGAENTANPLELLQSYATGSQSSGSTDPTVCETLISKLSPAESISIFKEQAGDGSNIGTTLKSARDKAPAKTQKTVTFSDQLVDALVQSAKPSAEGCVDANSHPHNVKSEIVQNNPIARRPVTRSMSPSKPTSPTSKEKVAGPSKVTSPSARRLTRFAIAQGRNLENQAANTTPKRKMQKSPLRSIMNRNLELEFGTTEAMAETEQQRVRREIMESYPSFDLGFGTPPAQVTEPSQEPAGQAEPPVVISSNEDSGDSLDKIFSAIDIPVRTPDIVKVHQGQQSPVSPRAPNSYTPVPQAHQKRVLRAVHAQRSPFVQVENKIVASKPTGDLYNKICSFGGHSEDLRNKEWLIDYGDWHIYLRDFADAIRPTGWLSNSTCELALYVLQKELAQHKKGVMPLMLATKLRSPNCIHDKAVQKAFEFSSTNRLDHKELLMFSVLQNLSTTITTFVGHYYLIVLNLKAERFEVMDSMRSEGNPSLMADSAAIIGSIKHMWALKYHRSTIDISKFRTIFIDTPMQNTTCDCGYFMLKFIESWDGRRMLPPFSQKDIPAIRKILAKKLVDCEDNRIIWQELLFQN